MREIYGEIAQLNKLANISLFGGFFIETGRWRILFNSIFEINGPSDCSLRVNASITLGTESVHRVSLGSVSITERTVTVTFRLSVDFDKGGIAF